MADMAYILTSFMSLGAMYIHVYIWVCACVDDDNGDKRIEPMYCLLRDSSFPTDLPLIHWASDGSW